jgi:hypothetical protein
MNKLCSSHTLIFIRLKCDDADRFAKADWAGPHNKLEFDGIDHMISSYMVYYVQAYAGFFLSVAIEFLLHLHHLACIVPPTFPGSIIIP